MQGGPGPWAAAAASSSSKTRRTSTACVMGGDKCECNVVRVVVYRRTEVDMDMYEHM